MDYKEKFEDFLDKMQGLLDNAKKQGHIIVRVEDLENAFPELMESDDENKPNGGIVMEDFNDGNGFYKVNLAYLNEKQVEEIEELVKKWNPELKESEDELTWLTKYIEEEAYSLSMDIRDNEDRIKLKKLQKALAWLEKQGKIDEDLIAKKFLINKGYPIDANGTFPTYEELYNIIREGLENQCEQKPAKNIVETWKDMRLEVYQQASGNRHEPNCSDDSTKMFSLNDIDEIFKKVAEKQGEQKLPIEKLPEEMKTIGESLGFTTQKECDEYNKMVSSLIMSDNKVKPKFHEGEWVVFNDKHESVYQIEKIENFQYTLRHILGGSMPLSFSHEDMIRPWTISDAKDGDVLVCKDYGYNSYILFGEKNIHCWYNGQTEHFHPTTSCKLRKDATIYPATKEQRDILFQKMKESGYEWDVEKKELKKIEQKPADKEETKFKVGDEIKTANEEPLTITKIDEKGYWSEDLFICGFGDAAKWELVGKSISKIDPKFHKGDWVVVSTIKGDRVVQIASVEYLKDDYPSYITTEGRWFGNGTKARLLTDKDVEIATIPESKIVVSKSKYWSEEDEHWRQKIIDFMKHPDLIKSTPTLAKHTIDWLESLKQRYFWKPNGKNEKLTDVNHEYFSELLENDDSKDINDYAYQVAYCISHDWLKETATWDDVEKACKLGAEWNKRHHKSAWSDEDKKMIGRIRSIVEKYAFSQSAVDVNGDLCEKEYIDADNWLKSLKERYFWKPSKEQMHAFEQVYDWYNNNFAPSETLTSFYNDLKKLKVE